MNAQPDHSGENLAQIAPILDEAINELGETDRLAVLLRFFEQRDLRSVGAALGASENAAQKRIARALDELRSLLSRRGVALSGAGLATVLAGGGVTAAPAGLALSISTTALAGAAVGGGSLTLFKIMTMTKLKTGLIGAVAIAGVATPLVWQHREQVRLRNENQELRQRVAQLDQVNAGSGRMRGLLTNDARLSQDQLNDLMRLRAEVGALRRNAGDVETLRAQNRQLQAALANPVPQTEPLDAAAEEQKRAGLARLNFTKQWMLAIYHYASKNDGHVPESFEQALPFLPEHPAGEEGDPDGVARLTAQLTPDQYEIVYRGILTNLSNPAPTIVIREKEAWPAQNGGWNRSYGFGDGHSEVHRSVDGSFEAWETARMVSSPVSSPSGGVP